MPTLTIPHRSKVKSTKRYPPVNMYEPDIAAQKTIVKYWRSKVGQRFAYADLVRGLCRLEAEMITVSGKSLLESVAVSRNKTT